jgi:predicted anti-sigma-YlaC factor YlaD
MERLLPIECERTRRHVSLQLDDELSEVGVARLSAHLAGCAACREFAARAAASTRQLRTLPLEQPELPVLVPTRRRPAARAFQAVAAAAVVAVAFGVSALTGPGHRVASAPPISATRGEALISPEQELKLLHHVEQARITPHVQLVR